MTPLRAEILLHYFISAVDFERMEAPACAEMIKQLLYIGILMPSRGSGIEVPEYELTPLGRAYVELMLTTPIPTIKYIDPRELTHD